VDALVEESGGLGEVLEGVGNAGDLGGVSFVFLSCPSLCAEGKCPGGGGTWAVLRVSFGGLGAGLGEGGRTGREGSRRSPGIW
jgi:hypothetical protein